MVTILKNVTDCLNSVIGNKVVPKIISAKVLIEFHALIHRLKNFICFLELIVWQEDLLEIFSDAYSRKYLYGAFVTEMVASKVHFFESWLLVDQYLEESTWSTGIDVAVGQTYMCYNFVLHKSFGKRFDTFWAKTIMVKFKHLQVQLGFRDQNLAKKLTAQPRNLIVKQLKNE